MWRVRGGWMRFDCFVSNLSRRLWKGITSILLKHREVVTQKGEWKRVRYFCLWVLFFLPVWICCGFRSHRPKKKALRACGGDKKKDSLNSVRSVYYSWLFFDSTECSPNSFFVGERKARVRWYRLVRLFFWWENSVSRTFSKIKSKRTDSWWCFCLMYGVWSVYVDKRVA